MPWWLQANLFDRRDSFALFGHLKPRRPVSKRLSRFSKKWNSNVKNANFTKIGRILFVANGLITISVAPISKISLDNLRELPYFPSSSL